MILAECAACGQQFRIIDSLEHQGCDFGMRSEEHGPLFQTVVDEVLSAMAFHEGERESKQARVAEWRWLEKHVADARLGK